MCRKRYVNHLRARGGGGIPCESTSNNATAERKEDRSEGMNALLAHTNM